MRILRGRTIYKRHSFKRPGNVGANRPGNVPMQRGTGGKAAAVRARQAKEAEEEEKGALKRNMNA